jgi:hypothetical protein
MGRPVVNALVSLMNRAATRLARRPDDLRGAQERTLRRILYRARGTAFARDRELDGARTVEEYQARVPVLHYRDLEPLWSRAAAGEARVFSRDPVVRFALSSGTTGKGKLIPMTRSFLRTIHRQQLRGLGHYLRRVPDSRILLGRGLAVCGRPQIGTTPAGLPYGMVSGIAIETAHPVIRLRALPTPETLNTADWDRKLDRMVAEATGRRIAYVGGIASAILAFLTRARATMPPAAFRAFAAGLELIIASGVDYRIYRAAIVEILGKPVAFLDVYMCSEGILGFESADTPGAFELCAEDLFFEFVPEGDYLAGQYADRRLIDGCEPGQHYVLLLTNGSGAFSYAVGDLVRCLEAAPVPRFQLAGRVQLTLNVVTEKTTWAAVEKTVLDVSRELGGTPREFFVTARVDGGLPRYVWAVAETPEWRRADARAIGRRLDESLMRHNEHYRHFVNSQLGPSEIVFVDPAALEEWLAGRGTERGNAKVPRIVTDYASVADLLSGAVSRAGDRPAAGRS